MKTPAPKLKPQILEEASHWFVELNGDGESDTTTRAEFDAWLRRSPEHVQAYLQITALWENAELLAKGKAFTSDQLVARGRADSNVIRLGEVAAASPGSAVQVAKPSTQALSPKPQDSGPKPRVWAALAASFVLVIIAATFGYLYTQRGTYATGIGEQRSIALEDGTTIELNSRSKLRVRYDEERRWVELKAGQALFRVAHDSSRPFIVESNGTEVRAVGTQFDVYRKKTGTVVTVLEGKVAVSPAIPAEAAGIQSNQWRASLLTAGEQLTVPTSMLAATDIRPPHATEKPVGASEIEPVDTTAAIAWTRRQLVFQGTPLSEVIEEFNRYNTRPMKVECERRGEGDLCSTKISGVFSSTDPNPLLTFLRDLPDFRVEETKDEIRISIK